MRSGLQGLTARVRYRSDVGIISGNAERMIRMNNTDKAKADAARRMLLGKIEIEEVSMLLDMPIEKLKPIKEEIEEQIKKTYGDLDAYDFEKGTVIFDNYDDLGRDEDIPDKMPED